MLKENKRINWEIIFKFKTPFHIGSGFGFAGLVDKTAIRDADGLTYIPASTIKGNLRNICRKIALEMSDEEEFGHICETEEHPDICLGQSLCIICSIFGSAQHPGRLYFNHARLIPEDEEIIKLLNPTSNGLSYYESSPRTNIAISRIRQIAFEGHLFVSEIVNPALHYQTNLHGRIDQKGEGLLEKALFLMEHLGAQRSRGLGRLEIKLIKQEKNVVSKDHN